MAVDAVPTLSPLGKAYWAQLPVEAFNYVIKLNITASEVAPAYTFSPMSGDLLEADINTVDYTGLSTMITAYENEEMVDTYWLYLSTVEMPPPVGPAEVPVYYVDAEDNNNVLHYEVITAYYGQENIVTVDPSLVPANYTLSGESSASITVDDQGMPSPEWVTFYFQAQAMQGTLNIYYTDLKGNEVSPSRTRSLDPGSYAIQANPPDLAAAMCFRLTAPPRSRSQWTIMGVTSPDVIIFLYEPESTTGY